MESNNILFDPPEPRSSGRHGDTWATVNGGATAGNIGNIDALYLYPHLLDGLDTQHVHSHPLNLQSDRGFELVWTGSMGQSHKPGPTQGARPNLCDPGTHQTYRQQFPVLHPTPVQQALSNQNKRRRNPSKRELVAAGEKPFQERSKASGLSKPATIRCFLHIAEQLDIDLPREEIITEDGDITCHYDFSVLEEHINSWGFEKRGKKRKTECLQRDARLIRKYREYQPPNRLDESRLGNLRCTLGCPWTGNKRGDLEKHEKGHFPPEIWRCREATCQQAPGEEGVYVRKYGLRTHLRKKHGKNPTNEDMEANRLEIQGSRFPKRCCMPKCNERFDSLQARHEHFSSEHELESISRMIETISEQRRVGGTSSNLRASSDTRTKEEVENEDEEGKSQSDSSESDYDKDSNDSKHSSDDEDGNDPGPGSSGLDSNFSENQSSEMDGTGDGSSYGYTWPQSGSGSNTNTGSFGSPTCNFNLQLVHAKLAFKSRMLPCSAPTTNHMDSEGCERSRISRIQPSNDHAVQSTETHLLSEPSLELIQQRGSSSNHSDTVFQRHQQELHLDSAVSKAVQPPSQSGPHIQKIEEGTIQELQTTNDADLASLTSSLSRTAICASPPPFEHTTVPTTSPNTSYKSTTESRSNAQLPSVTHSRQSSTSSSSNSVHSPYRALVGRDSSPSRSFKKKKKQPSHYYWSPTNSSSSSRTSSSCASTRGGMAKYSPSSSCSGTRRHSQTVIEHGVSHRDKDRSSKFYDTGYAL